MVDLADLERDAEVALDARGVHRAENYGWQNEFETDPEDLGYAMWWEDPPYEHDLQAWQDRTKPYREPTEREQRLMELGADFFGFMKAVRYSIGLALLYQPRINPLRVDVIPFDIHEFTALTGLRAAADRVRDFVIVTVLGKKTDERDQLDRACDALSVPRLEESVQKLRTHLESANFLRKASNVALHGLGTQPGHVQRRMISADRRAFQTGTWDERPEHKRYDEMIREGKAADQKALADVEARVVSLCSTYQSLISAGEAAFRLEYWHRQRQLPARS